jgi:ornithine cyclodeaminase
MREADDAVIALADSIWVDTMVAAVETGDLTAPLGSGIISAADIAGDLRDLIAAGTPRRESATQITVFKAVGFAPCDLAAARLALAGAKPQAGATKLHATH